MGLTTISGDIISQPLNDNFSYLNTAKQANLNIVNILDYATGDGVTDDTTAIQNILDNNTFIFFDEGTYMINSTGISISSNTHIILHPNATIKEITNSLTSYILITIADAENVSITGKGRIQGDKLTHTGSTGEQGHCIRILGSKNVDIDARISDAWGDGIYIGPSLTGGTGYSQNINLHGSEVDNARRNGISVISVKGLKGNNNLVQNTDGTDPQCAIDFEPNNPTEFIQNIELLNLITLNNTKNGINIALNNTTNPISIKISNHVSSGDQVAFKVGGMETNVGGSIIYENPTCTTTAGAISVSGWSYLAPQIQIINPSIFIDYTVASIYDHSGINIAYQTIFGSVDDIGNIDIINPEIQYLNGNTGSGKDISFANFVSGAVKNIRLTGNKYSNIQLAGLLLESIIESEEIIYSIVGGETLPKSSKFATVYKNTVLQGTCTMTLSNADTSINYYKKNRLKVQAVFDSGTDKISVVPPVAETLMPATYANGLYSAEEGAFIELQRVGSVWWIVDIVGTWTAI